MDATKNRKEVTAETRTHHNITPIERSFLLYSMQTDDSPHVDPPQSSQAPSMTLPIKMGPGIEPVEKRYIGPV